MPTTRVQLALNVDESPRPPPSTPACFGVGPHKQREGYANFAVEDPPLKLMLFDVVSKLSYGPSREAQTPRTSAHSDQAGDSKPDGRPAHSCSHDVDDNGGN